MFLIKRFERLEPFERFELLILFSFQHLPHFFAILLPAGDDPIPIRIVEIFNALLRQIAGIEIRFVDIRT